MTTPNHGPNAGPHPHHDRLLIAAHAAGDLAGRELATAERVLAACEDCRALHADLLAIASATRDVPAPAHAAARDFRIAPERAAELARGGLWRRFLRPFARPSGAARPLAAAFTTLGVAGLLLSALPGMQLGGGEYLAVNAPAATDGRNAPQATEEPQDSAAPEFVASPGRDTVDGSGMPDDLGASSGSGSGSGKGSDSGAGPTSQPTAEENVAPEITAIGAGGSSGPSTLILLSVAFLAAGLGLVLLRVTALRLR